MPDTSTPITASDMPEGTYAIVEQMGHRTMVGRIEEIERFGTKFLQIEPLFGEVMLAPVLLGGGSLYQVTPCSADTAWARRPKQSYQLPPSVLATVPALALTSNEEQPSFLPGDEQDDDDEFEVRF